MKPGESDPGGARMAPAVLDIEDGWPLLPPPCPDEPRLPSAFPRASSDTTKAASRVWNILSSVISSLSL